MSESESLHHIVLMQFKQGTSTAEIDKIIKRFVRLQDLIEEVQGIEWGVNNSAEGLDEGLSHCFNLNFNSASDRDVYLVHPHHVRFAEWVGAWIERVVVFDYCPNY